MRHFKLFAVLVFAVMGLFLFPVVADESERWTKARQWLAEVIKDSHRLPEKLCRPAFTEIALNKCYYVENYRVIVLSDGTPIIRATTECTSLKPTWTTSYVQITRKSATSGELFVPKDEKAIFTKVDAPSIDLSGNFAIQLKLRWKGRVLTKVPEELLAPKTEPEWVQLKDIRPDQVVYGSGRKIFLNEMWKAGLPGDWRASLTYPKDQLDSWTGFNVLLIRKVDDHLVVDLSRYHGLICREWNPLPEQMVGEWMPVTFQTEPDGEEFNQLPQQYRGIPLYMIEPGEIAWLNPGDIRRTADRVAFLPQDDVAVRDIPFSSPEYGDSVKVELSLSQTGQPIGLLYVVLPAGMTYLPPIGKDPAPEWMWWKDSAGIHRHTAIFFHQISIAWNDTATAGSSFKRRRYPARPR